MNSIKETKDWSRTYDLVGLWSALLSNLISEPQKLVTELNVL